MLVKLQCLEGLFKKIKMLRELEKDKVLGRDISAV
jgi:hypothetical protein